MTTTEESESVYSATTSLIAEDLVLEYGKPEDFEGRHLKLCLNFKAMCCNHHIPNQALIYESLVKNRNERH